MIDDLHQIGWKAFQDLCTAIAAEILERPVQTFLPSNDGGRDAAFVGTWKGAADRPQNKSTIQCKHFGSPRARLTLSSLKDDLPKAKRLAARGLAHDYVIMTNAAVSGDADEKICEAFLGVGVAQCRVFGGDWVAAQLRSRPALRMLAPRVYNLADLGQFIDGRAYSQARQLLSAMGDDLRCFVTTDAHRRSVEALRKRRFVLLLGDPASGKSTIAAILALGALDDGCEGAIRISFPDQLERWNPDLRQVLWVDDAFGSNHLEPTKVDAWNSQLPMLRAAVKQGASVIFTSRNYIWEGAKRRIRLGQFPLLRESQVIIDVQGLAVTERAQILYNHIRLGDQSARMRKRLKPFLPSVAASNQFLPETARRLGSPEFTGRLAVSAEGVLDFVERPLEFLREVIERLDRPSRAAVALIFLCGMRGLPSPIPGGVESDTVVRLTGAHSAEIAGALEHMKGSLTLLVEQEDGGRWIFRHPTIADAYADLVADSPELIEIYLNGAQTDRLLSDVWCGPSGRDRHESKVRVPKSLYPLVLRRILPLSVDTALQYFLAERCERDFLKTFVDASTDLFKAISRIHIEMAYSTNVRLLAKLKECGLLPEEVRSEVVADIIENTLEWFDASVFHDLRLRSLLTEEEFGELAAQFRAKWLDDLEEGVDNFASSVSSTDQAGFYRDLKAALERAGRFFIDDKRLQSALPAVLRRLEERIGDEEDEETPSARRSFAHPSVTNESIELVTIFSDVDGD